MNAPKTCMQGVKLNVCLNLYMYGMYLCNNCFGFAVGLKHSCIIYLVLHCLLEYI